MSKTTKKVLFGGNWFTFSQNNSGGSFVIDESRGLGTYVIIQADTAEEANDKAQQIGIYFDGCFNGSDCECCGDRWYRVDENDGCSRPQVYGQMVSGSEFKERSFSFGGCIFIHQQGGVFKKVEIVK